MTSPLLEVRNLSVAFGSFRAVDRLSYKLERGETLGVVGESGCGKTLAALALLGLTPTFALRSGEALFDGQDLLSLDERTLEQLRGGRIAMIFQEPMTALNPTMTVGDQIAEMFVLHEKLTLRQGRREAGEALARVHISDPGRCIENYPHQLSGGMRQRVMIAMALACRPKLLVADEPTTALDVTVQSQIIDLILELQEQLDMAVLFISHNLGVICQVSDRVMVMYAGKAVEIASAETLLHEPMHPYTKALMDTLPRLGERRATLPSIPGIVPHLGTHFRGCRFADRCADAIDRCHIDPPALAAYAADHVVSCHLVSAPPQVKVATPESAEA